MVGLILPLVIGLFATSYALGQEERGVAKESRAASDAIDELVTRLSASPILWQNGLFPNLDLPATASTEQVIARVFQMTGFDQGHVKEYRIRETRAVRIPGGLPDVYTAVVVDTDLGRKTVLFQHQGAAVGWWSRVYESEPSA